MKIVLGSQAASVASAMFNHLHGQHSAILLTQSTSTNACVPLTLFQGRWSIRPIRHRRILEERVFFHNVLARSDWPACDLRDHDDAAVAVRRLYYIGRDRRKT